ncbi:MAG: SH3 domain-containing protein [Kofleriaceae bacterium]
MAKTALTLRAKPGENQDPAGTVAAGATLEILEVSGRWLRVKAGDVTGWTPRTTLVEATDQVVEFAPLAPRKLSVVVTNPAAQLREAADAGAAVVGPIAVGTQLTIEDGTVAGWLRVRDGARVGWIAEADITEADRPVNAVTDRPTRAVVRRAPRRWLEVAATLGYRTLSQRFTSDATGGLADYRVVSDASVAQGDVVARRDLPGHLVVGVDGQVRGTYSSPGIDYPGPTLAPGKIPFTMFEAGGGARVGYRRGPVEAAARLGGFYGAFLADDVDNAGRIPRERLLAGTVGLRLTIAPAATPVRIDAAGDLTIVGARSQTPGLRDGDVDAATAWWLQLGVSVPVARRLLLIGSFAVERATTRWSGMSQRWADVTSASRDDQGLLFQLGVGTGL